MYRQYNLLPVKRYTARGIFIDEIRVYWHIVTYVFSCVICFRFIHFILMSTAHALFLTCLPVSMSSALFLSCNCHGVSDRTCKQKSWLKCACFLYNIHVNLQCIVVSALKKTSKVNTILKVVIFKHSVILFRCSMIW